MRLKKIVSILLLGGLLALQAVSSYAAEDALAVSGAEADSLIPIMTKEDKAGQMLMFSPSQLCDGDWTVNIDQVLQNIDFYHVGSIVLLEEDLKNETAVQELTEKIRARNSIFPVMIAADQAGSLSGGLTKPSADTECEIGPFTTDSGEIWAYGVTQTPADSLENLGIQIDLSAGSGTQMTVVTAAKVSNGESTRPAMFTRNIVTDTLRSQFDGVILTDSLSMPAATENSGADMAVQYAIQAGADILLAPANPMNAYFGILSAVDEQLITEQQMNESVRRILNLKYELGVMN